LGQYVVRSGLIQTSLT